VILQVALSHRATLALMLSRRATISSLALVAGLVLAGSVGAAGDAGAVRATLVAKSNPRALAVVTGSLRGNVLRWRLTHHGLGASARLAQLRVAGRAVRLCSPCATFATGSVTLAPATARAARAGGAVVDVRGSRVTVSGKVALGTVPTLQIDVADGARLGLPAVVHYTVTGFRVGEGAGKVVASNGATDVSLQPGTQTGTFVLPDDKKLTGIRDLTFSLADANGTKLSNREATVKVYDVLLAGRR
jgi:hypothetical protein